MNFEINDEEAKRFIELVYLGNYLVNAERSTDSLIDYDVITEKVLARYIQNIKDIENVKNGEYTEDVKAWDKLVETEGSRKQEADDFKEELFVETNEKIIFFQKASLPFVLSQFLADSKCPIKEGDGDSYARNYFMQEICEDAIEKQGAEIIRLDIPDLEERMEKAEWDEKAREAKREELQLDLLRRQQENIPIEGYKAISLRIHQLLKELHVNQYQLMKRSRLPISLLKKMIDFQADRVMEIAIEEICKGLGISFPYFYSGADLFDNNKLIDTRVFYKEEK